MAGGVELPGETSHLNEITGVFRPEEDADHFNDYIQTLRQRRLTAA